MVPITDVYQRVLVVLNKENRGYVTRDEFSSLAQQAQLEIFESYFTKHALSIAGENDTTYSNPCLLYTSPSPRDATLSRMPSSA